MENLSKLISEIRKIVHQERAIREERRRRGEFYNIFDILNLSSSEVRLHSAFIANLLDRNATHGMGDAFLKSFIEIVLPDFSETFDISSSKVYVEYVIDIISISDNEHGGRLDILVKNEKHQAIIIENKIYAGDQPLQLRRYYNYAKDAKYKPSEFRILYLTLDGHEASKESTGDKKPYYSAISYRIHIINWLKRCVEIAACQPLVRETIRQYIVNLEQLLNMMGESNQNAMIETLVKEDNLSAALSIIDAGDVIKSRIRKDFIENRLKAIAEKYGFQMEYDDQIVTLKAYQTIRFWRNNVQHFYYFISIEGRCAWEGIFYKTNEKEEKVTIEGLNQLWNGGKGKDYPFGWGWMKFNNWNDSDILKDMRYGHNLINDIEKTLIMILDNNLLEKAEKAYVELHP